MGKGVALGVLLKTNMASGSTGANYTEILLWNVFSAVAGHPGLDAQEIGHKTGNSALQDRRIAFDNILGNNLSLVILIHDCKNVYEEKLKLKIGGIMGVLG